MDEVSDRDLFAAFSEQQGSDGQYDCFRIDPDAADPQLLEDLAGVECARWLCFTIREAFENSAYGNRIHGPVGTFDGVIADGMPGYWSRVRDDGIAPGRLWKPDGRHPVGKWFADAADRLLSLPPPEILDAVLRKHGIEGSRKFMPTLQVVDTGGYALMIHGMKGKSLKQPGLSRDDSLRHLWKTRCVGAGFGPGMAG